jgi:hypothetical protein
MSKIQGRSLPGNKSLPLVNNTLTQISNARSAALPALHEEACKIVDDCFNLREQSPAVVSHSSPGGPATKPSENLRRILVSQLPPKETADHFLRLFFVHQNALFHLYEYDEAQARLDEMYNEPTQLRLSWFCQFFLLFSVAIQFDDTDDFEAAGFFDTGRKHLDDAIDENPESDLWVIPAMLLICLYQPPAQWHSMWIYLGLYTES